jgi:predicted permease
MKALRRFVARLIGVITRRRNERRLREEIADHLEQQTVANIGAGMSPEEARRQAILKFGAVERIKEDYRERESLPFVESLLQDTRYALRGFRKNPAFSAAAVLTLALGTGANVAVFTLVDAVLLRPLPFDEPDRLVMLSESHIESGQQRVGVLPGSFVDWRERSRSFEAISLLDETSFLITNRQEPARIRGAYVSPNFFELMRVAPLLGRTFPSTDAEAKGHEREVVISYGLWHRWFGGDSGVLGQTLEVNQSQVPLTIVGVMPPGFAFPRGVELWRHYTWRSSARGDRIGQAIGRMRGGVSVETARNELEQISRRLAVEFPATNTGWTATVDPLRDVLLGPVEPALAATLAAAGFVFLIACANVATLVLLRGLGRQRELAIRAALGASRGRLARQSLVEHLVLAAAGTLAGGLLAITILDGLIAFAPPAIPRLDAVSMDVRTLAYLMALALTTMAITGAIPAFRSSRIEVTAALKSGTESRGPGIGGKSLVVAEIAFAGVLLAGAGLMVRTMVNLQRIDIGFEPSGVVQADLTLPIGRLTEGPVVSGTRPAWDRLALFYGGLVEQIEGLPGIQRAALVAAPSYGRELPFSARTGIVRPRSDGSPAWRAIQRRVITPHYFEVLQMPLVRGRAFNESDNALEFLRSDTGRRRGVAVVNQAAAQQFWPGEDSLGRLFTIDGEWSVEGRVVVGVVGNARDLAPDIQPQPTVYVPYAEIPDFGATLLARVAGDSAPVAAIRARLRSTDSSLMIGEIRPLSESYGAVLAPRRFTTMVLTAFAGFGVLLAAVGLYGLIAVSVARRTREIGIRMALGAHYPDVLTLVLSQALKITLVGLMLGLFGAAATTHYFERLLFGLTPLDWTTFAAVSLLFSLVAALASYVPARRAARIDPLVALRYE